MTENRASQAREGPREKDCAAAGLRLFLGGDVMLGRGIDQIFATPSKPALFESHVRSALGYVRLAETAHGAIPRGAGPDYVWGDLIADLDRAAAGPRIVNLETAITLSDTPAPKGINYRMHPANAACLATAGIDCCVLANNHVLDWGREGLGETLETLERLAIHTAGAGRDAAAAAAPAMFPLSGGGRLVVFAFGAPTSGIPEGWAAGGGRPGVNLLPGSGAGAAAEVAAEILKLRRPGDLVVVSVHWGSNWGYEVPRAQVQFAHALIDAGACDLLHGHSSHHPRPMEVHGGRLILYGCGDLLNDYEGISGYESFRDDLALAYLPRLGEDGTLEELTLLAYQIRRFRLQRASESDAAWLETTLGGECSRFATRLVRKAGNRLILRWD